MYIASVIKPIHIRRHFEGGRILREYSIYGYWLLHVVQEGELRYGSVRFFQDFPQGGGEGDTEKNNPCADVPAWTWLILTFNVCSTSRLITLRGSCEYRSPL